MMPPIVKDESDRGRPVAPFRGSVAVATSTQGCALGWYMKPLRGHRFVVSLTQGCGVSATVIQEQSLFRFWILT